MSQLTHGSLFDGFGGLRRGLEDAGFQTKWARDLIYGNDIETDDPDSLERVELISGGPVCRRTSRAATWHRQRTNESLWPFMLRTISALSPKWVLVEQPASVDRALIETWVADLECLGYGVAGRIIDSKHWVPQQRARWFLVGSLGSKGLALWDRLYPDCHRMERHDLQGSQSLRFDGDCADCMRGGIYSRISARRTALVGAGNAVNQPVAKYLGKRIIEADKNGGTLGYER